MKINLLVLRCKDLEISRQFYESLGFHFVEERHGKGVAHYSSEDAGLVFELYPLKESEGPDNSRLGFTVRDLQEILTHTTPVAEYEINGKRMYIVQDPDGRKIEIS